jgi:hypothetical protein
LVSRAGAEGPQKRERVPGSPCNSSLSNRFCAFVRRQLRWDRIVAGGNKPSDGRAEKKVVICCCTRAQEERPAEKVTEGLGVRPTLGLTMMSISTRVTNPKVPAPTPKSATSDQVFGRG